MTRCYLSPEQWGEGEIRLSGREAHHMVRVFRVAERDELLCTDGTGREAPAQVLRVSPRELLLSIGPTRSMPEPSFRLTLAVAIPGQGRMDEIVNQAAQMGVSRILPLVTERTVVPLSAFASGAKQGRLRRIAVEAIKQSGSGRIPEIRPAHPFNELILSFKEYDRVLLASVQGPWEPLEDLLTPHPSPFTVLLLIGPEGDFSPEEIDSAVRAGARRFSLGPTVLRCETACVAAVSVVSHLLREQSAL